MRFTTAWAKVAAQNVSLKVATVTLAVIAAFQLIVISSLASRDPLVIDRACYSRLVFAKPIDPSQNEIKAFLNEALSMRFDSDGYIKAGFLSIEETIARDKEQVALKSRQMTQKIIVSDIRIDGGNITVEADRLISVGKIKSALPLNLRVTLQQTNRTESNPYGLILELINQIEEKEVK